VRTDGLPLLMTTGISSATLLVAGALALACCRPSSASDAGFDAGTDGGVSDGGPFIIGPHQPYPTMPWNGGPVLTQPNLVTITYSTDPNSAAREAFGDWVFTSQWFAAWRDDYGVSGGSHLAKVRLSGAPPSQMDETSIGTMLLNALADGGLPTSMDGGVLYALYVPVGPSLTFQCHQVCESLGSDFVGGFHWEASQNGQKIAFAVVPTCTAAGITESQGQVDFSASHELAEAITDPFPLSNVGYDILDSSSPWNALGGEVGDVCSGQGVVESGHTLQRVWSNASASDGGAPCVPALPGAFYAASPTATSALNFVAGQAADVTIQGWSTALAPTWSLGAFVSPPAPCLGNVDAGSPSFTPSLNLTGLATINNNQSRALRIGVPASAPSGSSALVVIVSSQSATDFSLWPVLIQVQ
jgi:hypothetical protein